MNEKRNALVLTAASAVVMLLLPWAAATLVHADAAMAVCFLLFYGINPLFSIAAGAFSGRALRKRWALPIVPAALFLLGAWLCFGAGESAFVLYAAVYLAAGAAAMLLSALLCRLSMKAG